MFSSFSHKTIATLLWTVVLAQSVFGATVTAVQTQSIAQNDVIANTWFQQANDRLVPFSVSSGNVGIGIASPTDKIHVVGNALYETGDRGFKVKWSYNTSVIVNAWASSNPDLLLQQNGTDKFIVWYDQSTQSLRLLSWLTGNVALFHINAPSNSFVVWNSWNVGIGTISPWAKLEVAWQVKITWGSPWAGKVLTSDANGLASWQTASGGSSNQVCPGSGSSNTCYWVQAMFANTSGYQNAAFGYTALNNNTTGYHNTSFGAIALSANTTGYQNTAIGAWTLFQNTTGNWNTGVWQYALWLNSTGNGNTGVWQYAIYSNTTGYQNTANGYQALWQNTTGWNNTALGNSAWSSITTGSNNIVIGASAQVPSATSSNQLSIGNWIYWNWGNIWIWITVPTLKLDVNWDFRSNKIFVWNDVINVIRSDFNSSWDSNSKWIKIVTNIPNNENQMIHRVTIRWHHTWGSNPITMDIKWRNWNGWFSDTNAQFTDTTSYSTSPIVSLNTEGWVVVIYITHSDPNYFWYYSLTADAYYGQYSGSMQTSWYNGWTISRITSDPPAWVTAVPIKTTFPWSVYVYDSLWIGWTNASYKLFVNGTAWGTSWTNTSDIRLKKNIETLPTSSLDSLFLIRPVSFDWKSPKDEYMKQLQYGFVAQEVEKIYPNLVTTAQDEMKTKSVNYDGFIPLLVSSVQELKKENDELRARIEKLEANQK